MKYFVAGYAYTPAGVQKDVLIAIADDGHIVSVAPQEGAMNCAPTEGPVEYLPDVILLPGFVNVHSHAFQRALRGHTHRSRSRRDTFWTWREAMYTEAERLNPDSIYELALLAYREMRRAGYTTVGEFHYVHHQPDGRPYAEPNAMAEAVLQAGRKAGIRVVLLMSAYAQAGFGQPPEERQRRFCDASVEAFLERVDALRVQGVPVGVAPHSVRAVPESWFRAIAEYTRTYSLPLHVHADEQRAEIEQCQAAYGCTPIELLERFEALGPHTTIIHATHATHKEIALLAQYRCNVCVCPTTEGDLGDGIAPYAELLKAKIPLSIGSDSNTRIDPIEELRWAEYTARMRYQRRRILVADELGSPGPVLMEYGTRNGGKALGIETGAIAPGMWADFVGMDVRLSRLEYWNEQDFADVLFFGTSADALNWVWVGGEKV